MTGKNLYSSQLINYFIWTTTKSYNNKVDQAHVYLTHFFYLKVCVHSSAVIISTIHANTTRHCFTLYYLLLFSQDSPQ